MRELRVDTAMMRERHQDRERRGNGAWVRGVRKQRVNGDGTRVCRFFGKWVEKSERGVIDIREATPLGVDPPFLVGLVG